jgi:rod shape-determining protein MreC
MAVVTPDGIVGKVIAAYPVSSEVLLVTDPEFAAGVMSQNAKARGTLKGQGSPICKVDYVAFEDKVETGEWFYASGDDRIFPRGFPVGMVKSVRPGQPFKEILLEPSGLQHGLEDVLIVISVVHQDIPDTPVANQPVFISPGPPAAAAPAAGTPTAPAPSAGTEADRLRTLYKSAGDAQGHVFGEGGPGTKPPDFTKLGGGAPPGGPGQVNPTPAAPPKAGRGTAGGDSPRPPAQAPPAATPGAARPATQTPPSATPTAPSEITARPVPDGRGAAGGQTARPSGQTPPPAPPGGTGQTKQAPPTGSPDATGQSKQPAATPGGAGQPTRQPPPAASPNSPPTAPGKAPGGPAR